MLLTHGGLDQLLDFLEGRGLEGGEPRAQVDEALEGNSPKELGDEGAKTGASDEEPGDSLWQGGCRGEAKSTQGADIFIGRAQFAPVLFILYP